MEVVLVPAFSDNYIFVGHANGEAFIVDPGDAAPVLAEVERRGWRVRHILNTHWHADHVGGNAAVKTATGAEVIGPAAEAAKIGTLDRTVREGDEIVVAGERARVIEVPGHTAGHIAFLFEDAGVAFVGDTLFACGCGRLFEGTAEQMWTALQRLTALPEDTRLYCAHEYTAGNVRFAAHADPGNAAVSERRAAVDAARARGEPTVPTTVALERATNPFVRATDAAALGRLRAEKDGFRG